MKTFFIWKRKICIFISSGPFKSLFILRAGISGQSQRALGFGLSGLYVPQFSTFGIIQVDPVTSMKLSKFVVVLHSNLSTSFDLSTLFTINLLSPRHTHGNCSQVGQSLSLILFAFTFATPLWFGQSPVTGLSHKTSIVGPPKSP